jgi:hypothetical protein
MVSFLLVMALRRFALDSSNSRVNPSRKLPDLAIF